MIGWRGFFRVYWHALCRLHRVASLSGGDGTLLYFCATCQYPVIGASPTETPQ